MLAQEFWQYQENNFLGKIGQDIEKPGNSLLLSFPRPLCHSHESGNPSSSRTWFPAFAGMTETGL
jgi:hypothetical protein